MRFGFTGTRRGMTANQRESLARILTADRPTEFHHGQCVGADAEAHAAALAAGVPLIVVHPATDPSLLASDLPADPGGRVVYLPPRRDLARNKQIVRAVDRLLAAPAQAEEEIRSGTWFTVRYARRRGVEVVLLLPY